MINRKLNQIRSRTFAVAMVLLGAGAMIASIPHAVEAQESRGSTVAVQVTDGVSGLALAGADVKIKGSRNGLVTDTNGLVRVVGVGRGKHAIEVKRVGYAPFTSSVTTTGSDTVVVSVQLASTVNQLAKVDVKDTFVRPTLQEFEERRKRGKGRFITESQIDEAKGSSLDALLSSHFPRVRAQDGKIFKPALEATAGGVTRCELVVYLDGFRLYEARVEDIDVKNIAGVEYYTLTQIPVQYQSMVGKTLSSRSRPNSACGVVLFWSK